MVYGLQRRRGKSIRFLWGKKLSFYDQCPDFEDSADQAAGDPAGFECLEGLVGQQKERRFVIVFAGDVSQDFRKIGGV